MQLKDAEAMARTASDWLACAREWDVLGDAAASRRSLERAAEHSICTSEWLACARRARDLGWEAGTFGYLEKAEALAGTAEESLDCAQMRRRLNDPEGTRRDLARAKSRSQDVASWLRLAAAWRTSDIAEAAQCVLEARARAARIDEWLSIAEFHDDPDWILDRKKAGISETELGQAISDCIVHAERLSREPRDWLACATIWRRLTQSDATNPVLNRVLACTGAGDAAVRRCILGAEADARTGIELEHCMRAWLNLLSDEAEAERCRTNARRLVPPRL